MAPLGDVALGRSGDKGANVNCGLYIRNQDDPSGEKWNWLRTLMTKAQMQKMIGSGWEDWYYIERCELPGIRSVHFVVYGPLGRGELASEYFSCGAIVCFADVVLHSGVSSSKILDGLGKGFAEFIRDVHVPIPKRFLNGSSRL
jgi:hypothetical protein